MIQDYCRGTAKFDGILADAKRDWRETVPCWIEMMQAANYQTTDESAIPN